MGQSFIIINIFSSKDFINCFYYTFEIRNSLLATLFSVKIYFFLYNFPTFQAASK